MTFWEINIALQVVNIEAPEEAGDEVDEVGSNVVAEPRLEEVGEWVPHSVGEEGAEDETVVEGGLCQNVFHPRWSDSGGIRGGRVGFRHLGAEERKSANGAELARPDTCHPFSPNYSSFILWSIKV